MVVNDLFPAKEMCLGLLKVSEERINWKNY